MLYPLSYEGSPASLLDYFVFSRLSTGLREPLRESFADARTMDSRALCEGHRTLQ
jgi:hypothetical protein